MLKPAFAKQFDRDLKRMLKRYKGRRECHIEPDWLKLTRTKSFLKEQEPILI